MKGQKVIIGLGKTGYACAAYFARHDVAFSVMDANPAPAWLDALHELAPGVPFGKLDADAMCEASELVVSPGVPLALPEIQAAIQAGVLVTGDVAMFGELADAPVVAITGSNGKSTVTALVSEMARQAGVHAGTGGNIGVPCLDLLEQGFELYILEVSSYQLETATSLRCKVGTVLSLSPDHQDRYPSLDAYYSTKTAIYANCEIAIVNRDIDYDLGIPAGTRTISFGAGEPASDHEFGLCKTGGQTWLARGENNLMPVDELPIKGGHNHLNALAALAIGAALDWGISPMLDALRQFPGLPHRCEWVANVDGVDYINDSKATNIGSTLAAIEGLATGQKAIRLILGGDGKGADFTVLRDTIALNARQLYIYGRDREVIAGQLAGAAPVKVMTRLDQVVSDIKSDARPGELVLFSPACASLDQFKNFEARGDAFKSLVIGEAQP